MKRFPMADGPTIDWETAERIHKVYRCLGHTQSLQRIAERGGFGWEEVHHLWEAHRRMCKDCRCHEKL